MKRIYDDPYDILQDMLQVDRKLWVEIIKKFIVETNENNIVIDGYKFIEAKARKTLTLPMLNCFRNDYQGKFNIGDYVTTKDKGGYYRVIDLPVLDIRFNAKERYKDDYFTWAEDISMYGDGYYIAGLNNKLEPCTSDKDMFTDIDYILTPSDKDLIKIYPNYEIREKINSFIYKFDFLYGIKEILKQTETYDHTVEEIANSNKAKTIFTPQYLAEECNLFLHEDDKYYRQLLIGFFERISIEINKVSHCTNIGFEYYFFSPDQLDPNYKWSNYNVGDIVSDGWDLYKIISLPPIRSINKNTLFTGDNIHDILDSNYTLNELYMNDDGKLVEYDAEEFELRKMNEEQFYLADEDEIKQVVEFNESILDDDE